jgi:hypothetical protein
MPASLFPGRCVRSPIAVVLVLLFCSPAFTQRPSSMGLSPDSNPAISVNALFLGVASSDDERISENSDGFQVQELEVQFSSLVDPYWKADFILALPEGEGIEVEEGFVRSLGLGGNMQLQIGKFYAALGRHNLLHTHAFAFLDAPLVNERLLGEEGLNEAGISLSWLTPLPWFAEVTGQVLDGRNEHFASNEGKDLLYLGHLKSFHEIGDATTVEVGLSAAAGANSTGGKSSLHGIDLTFKWHPLGASTQRDLIWQTEYLRSDDDSHLGQVTDGLYSMVQVQFARRWWLEGRLDVMEIAEARSGRDWRGSALLALVPSEFSSVRLQYSRLHTDRNDANQLLMQLNVTIGSHPAHRY